jgi:four helix bundle protein
MESYYKNLNVWKKSIDLVEQIYQITATFPKSEQYSLIDQIRRASISIPSNIAEWSGRSSEADYVRFLYIAKWSAMEIETQIIIAKRLKYIDDASCSHIENDIIEVLKMLSWLIASKSALLKN